MQAYRGENVAHARAHGGNLSHMTATRRHRVGRCRNASVTRAPFAVGSDDGRPADTAPRDGHHQRAHYGGQREAAVHHRRVVTRRIHARCARRFRGPSHSRKREFQLSPRRTGGCSGWSAVGMMFLGAGLALVLALTHGRWALIG